MRSCSGHAPSRSGWGSTPIGASPGGADASCARLIADERRLVAVARVERRGRRRERPVQRVHERRRDAVCHRERREAAVVVDDVERDHDRRRCRSRRTLRATWSTSYSARSISSGWDSSSSGTTSARDAEPGAQNSVTSMPPADQRLGEDADDRLDATVPGRRHGDPGRSQHRDPHGAPRRASQGLRSRGREVKKDRASARSRRGDRQPHRSTGAGGSGPPHEAVARSPAR